MPEEGHSLPYVANLSILFKEVPLLERAAAARDAGFTDVEYWWPFDGDMSAVAPQRAASTSIAKVPRSAIDFTRYARGSSLALWIAGKYGNDHRYAITSPRAVPQRANQARARVTSAR